MGTDAVRVVVADDHRAFAEAIAIRLAVEPDIDVVGVAQSAAVAEQLVLARRPSVALLDVEFADGDGVALGHRLLATCPGVKVILLTFHDDVRTATAAARAGVAGFVAKDATSSDLVRVVRGVVRGETWVEPRVLGGVLEELARGPAPSPEQDRLDRLTLREREVLDGMVRGLDRPAIARELFVSTNTVRTHLRNMLAKLEVHSSLEAVALAIRAGGWRPVDDGGRERGLAGRR